MRPPQVGPSQPQEETPSAIFTQLLSHDASQQYGSWLQTASQHAVSLHDGPTCGKQQEPVPLSPHSGGVHAASGPRAQDSSAAATHDTSQATSQQYESAAQITVQHARSLHAVRSCGSQHGPEHTSPHYRAQLHASDPSASSTQNSSQKKSRQKFSVSNSQTASQQSVSRHFGES